jgi:hypothetical protein
MHSFTDKKGRTWSFDIDYGTVLRCKREMKVDLLSLVEDGCRPLAALGGDIARLVDLVWWLVRDQNAALNLDREGLDFAEGLGGDVLGQARDAFVQSVLDFFPDPERRKALGVVVQKNRELMGAVAAQGVAMLEAVDLQAEAKEVLQRAREKASAPSTSGTPSTTPAPSSGSVNETPPPTPSGG